ncbi:MAG: hypothetical protein H6621_06180 [Halobacteriovoraceae bacterium]|nr:hypothetical protein [Halobacteriovoraceae bacterium]
MKIKIQIFLALSLATSLVSCKFDQEKKITTFQSSRNHSSTTYNLKLDNETEEISISDGDILSAYTEDLSKRKKLKFQIEQIKKEIQQCQEDCEDLESILSIHHERLNKVNEIIISRRKENFNRKKSFQNFFSEKDDACQNLDSYVPSPYDPIKVINLSLFLPQRSDPNSPGNFTKLHNGQGNKEYNIEGYFGKWIATINNLISSNTPDREKKLPVNIPKLQFRIQRIKTPVIKEADYDKYYYANSAPPYNTIENVNKIPDGKYFKLDHDSYNVVFQDQKGIPNVYPATMMTNQNGDLVETNAGDEYVVASFTFFNVFGGNGFSTQGIENGRYSYAMLENEWLNHVTYQRVWNGKQNQYENDKEFRNQSLSTRAKLFLHEFGHGAGLHHNFSSSFNRVLKDINNDSGGRSYDYYACDDLQQTKSNPWCGGSSGNNIMDYNCTQNSISNCQLKIMHYNLQLHQDDMLYKPCNSDPEYTTTIPSEAGAVVWNAHHDLAGDLIVESGATLKITCGITMANDAKIIIEDGANIEGMENIQRRSSRCFSTEAQTPIQKPANKKDLSLNP